MTFISFVLGWAFMAWLGVWSVAATVAYIARVMRGVLHD